MRHQRLLQMVAILSLAACPVSAHDRSLLPIFPGAIGFGTTTPAGRGGEILRVTTLADAGPGSLRAALATSGPRIVVFEVGGTIRLATPLEVTTPFLTVAGQSAPPPGITLRGAGLVLRSHDLFIKHLRIRIGDDADGPPPGNRDGVEILGPEAWNIVLDHLSISWAIDENLSTWYPVRDITISHSIVAEGLQHSLHPKGAHSKGILIGARASNVALTGNLLVHNAERNPRLLGATSVFFADNLIYNCGGRHCASIGSPDGPARVAAVGNWIISGPDSAPGGEGFKVEGGSARGTAVYLADNRGNVALKNAAPFTVRVASSPLATSPAFGRRGASEAELLAAVGARPLQRDAVDERLVREVIRRGGKIIDSPAQVGGWPATPAQLRPLRLPAQPHDDDDGDGYTNIEELLLQMAVEIEGEDNRVGGRP